MRRAFIRRVIAHPIFRSTRRRRGCLNMWRRPGWTTTPAFSRRATCCTDIRARRAFRILSKTQASWSFQRRLSLWASVTLPVSGGFYVRALPYAFVKRALRTLNAAGQPAIMYVHPWELDLGQDYPHVTARERITHYHGRRGLEAKLRSLFSDFRFTTLGGLYRSAGAGRSVCAGDKRGPRRTHVQEAVQGMASVGGAAC